jgi:L-lactate dehydrogenase complex protein LldG
MTTREQFLDRIRSRQAPPPSLGPHPPPELRPFEVRHRSLAGIGRSPSTLLPVFTEAATRAGAVVHTADPDDVEEVVTGLVADVDGRNIVLSRDAEASALRGALVSTGAAVHDHEPALAARADVGITSAVAGVAATGSVVLSAGQQGGRGAAVLPRVHLCLLPAERLVATTLDALRAHAGALPSNLTFVTGPSRTGDIELILTVGVHGPVAVHILVITDLVRSCAK